MSIDDARRDTARAARAKMLGLPEWMMDAAEAVPTKRGRPQLFRQGHGDELIAADRTA
jgi:hypothetical protein